MSGKVRGLILGLLSVSVLSLTPFRLLKISGRSMEPTLRHGETYVLDHFYWKPGGLRRDDIVVLNHREERWVKRLIGMPGDLLQIQKLPDGWITHVGNLTVSPAQRRTEGLLEERRVAPDEIFIIGDNLNRSADSTVSEAGSFKLKDVIGVVRTFTLRREFPFRKHL
jgi:signal peptidase I